MDAGYVVNNRSFSGELPNSLLLSGGVGLDLVTYYDIVTRFELSMNKMGEHGFFIHFIAPI